MPCALQLCAKSVTSALLQMERWGSGQRNLLKVASFKRGPSFGYGFVLFGSHQSLGAQMWSQSGHCPTVAGNGGTQVLISHGGAWARLTLQSPLTSTRTRN